MMCGCIKECFLSHLDLEKISNYNFGYACKINSGPSEKRLMKDFESTF